MGCHLHGSEDTCPGNGDQGGASLGMGEPKISSVCLEPRTRVPCWSGGAFVFACLHWKDAQASWYLRCGRAARGQPVPVTQRFGPGDPSLRAIPHKTNPTEAFPVFGRGLITCWSQHRARGSHGSSGGAGGVLGKAEPGLPLLDAGLWPVSSRSCTSSPPV